MSLVQNGQYKSDSHCYGLHMGSQDFPDSSVVKECDPQAGDAGVIPGLGRSPGEANGNPLQYSGLENPKDRGAWQWQSRGHKEWDTTEMTEHACMPVPSE